MTVTEFLGMVRFMGAYFDCEVDIRRARTWISTHPTLTWQSGYAEYNGKKVNQASETTNIQAAAWAVSGAMWTKKGRLLKGSAATRARRQKICRRLGVFYLRRHQHIDPMDRQACAVFADWLEERGDPLASFLRHHSK